MARVLAYYVHDLSPFVIRFSEQWGVRWYGLSYVLSFVVGFYLYRHLARKGLSDLPPDHVSDFITMASLLGVLIGGRLGWALFYGYAEFFQNPLVILRVMDGGMSSHGGILGLVLFTFWYSKRHKVSWTGIGDALCCVAPPGIFLVRCANFINGELWGKPATVPWAVIFPEAGDLPRHPSQIYEALLEGLLLFAILWPIRKWVRVPRGVITGIFFIGYATLRIIGETFREPDLAIAVGGLSSGQFLSLFMYGIGAAFIIWGFKAQKYERAWQEPDPAK